MYIHKKILKAVLPLMDEYELETIDLVGELCHAAWELTVLNAGGVKKLLAELESRAE